MGLPVETADYDRTEVDGSRPRVSWAEEIRRRVEEIRSGPARQELQEVLAELERYEAEIGAPEWEASEGTVDDPTELESAWGDEIQARIQEIEEGTVPTYAAEDVMAALRARFG